MSYDLSGYSAVITGTVTGLRVQMKRFWKIKAVILLACKNRSKLNFADNKITLFPFLSHSFGGGWSRPAAFHFNNMLKCDINRKVINHSKNTNSSPNSVTHGGRVAPDNTSFNLNTMELVCRFQIRTCSFRITCHSHPKAQCCFVLLLYHYEWRMTGKSERKCTSQEARWWTSKRT